MRKCIVCGFELGDEEQYCGNCGTKAPNGAVDKIEAEFENITPNEKKLPHCTLSLKFHDYLVEPRGHLFIRPGFMTSVLAGLFADHPLMAAYIFAMSISPERSLIKSLFSIIGFLFGLLYLIGLFYARYVIVELINFNHHAPQKLYALCVFRIVALPLYQCIATAMGQNIYYIHYLCAFEIIYGLILLIILYLYYSKRESAFIY